MSTIDPVQRALNQHLLSAEQCFKRGIIIEENTYKIDNLCYRKTTEALNANDGAMLADWIGDNCKEIAKAIVEDVYGDNLDAWIFNKATKAHLEMFRKEAEDQFIQDNYS